MFYDIESAIATDKRLALGRLNGALLAAVVDFAILASWALSKNWVLTLQMTAASLSAAALPVFVYVLEPAKKSRRRDHS
ncbi:MAG TPA: hypothetical protein VGA08_02115 [Candidatus Saccharimonadales bacterium]